MHLAFRWVLTACVALMLGVVAPCHHHLDGLPSVVEGHVAGSHESLSACCLVLAPDVDTQDCAVCDFKGRMPLGQSGVPALPALTWSTPTSDPAPARAPPAEAHATAFPRAPPTLVKLDLVIA